MLLPQEQAYQIVPERSACRRPVEEVIEVVVEAVDGITRWGGGLVFWRERSPAVLFLIAATLAVVAGPTFLFGVLAAHDAFFYYTTFAAAIVLLLLAAARAAHSERSRLAAALGAAASTPAVGFIVVTYGYSQVHSLDGHPFGWAAMLLAAVLYLGCIALAAVLVPLKLRAGADVVLGTMFLVATLLLVGFYVLAILSGAGSG